MARKLDGQAGTYLLAQAVHSSLTTFTFEIIFELDQDSALSDVICLASPRDGSDNLMMPWFLRLVDQVSDQIWTPGMTMSVGSGAPNTIHYVFDSLGERPQTARFNEIISAIFRVDLSSGFAPATIDIFIKGSKVTLDRGGAALAVPPIVFPIAFGGYPNESTRNGPVTYHRAALWSDLKSDAFCARLGKDFVYPSGAETNLLNIWNFDGNDSVVPDVVGNKELTVVGGVAVVPHFFKVGIASFDGVITLSEAESTTMALGPSVKMTDEVLVDEVKSEIVRPTQMQTGWLDVIDAGGMDDADNSGNDITNPATQITLSTRKLVTIEYGTTLLLRMAYDAAATISTAAVVEVFGRRDSNDSWQRLENKAEAYNVTMTAAATDISDGTLLYTRHDEQDHAFDLNGCREILCGVKTAHAVSAGAAALAKLQAKAI